MARASDCRSEGCEFESHRPRLKTAFSILSVPLTRFCFSLEPAKTRCWTPKNGMFDGMVFPFVPVAIALCFSLLGCEKSGHLATASDSCPWKIWVYRDIAKFISLCLIIIWMVLGCTPAAANKLPMKCLSAWKSAYRPASST